MTTSGGTIPGARGDQADEVLAIIDRIGPVVLSTTKEPTSKLRRMVGMLMSDKNMTNIQIFVYAFGACLDLARQAGATLATMDRVRKAALAEAPVSFEATQTTLAIIRLTLATQARIVAYTQFRSRQEVDETATALNEVFNQTSEIAADELDQGTYVALIKLHGDIVQHLAAIGRVLPRVINYKYQMVMPALRMAQMAYGSAERYRELISENKVVHPAFMPREGKMLALGGRDA